MSKVDITAGDGCVVVKETKNCNTHTVVIPLPECAYSKDKTQQILDAMRELDAALNPLYGKPSAMPSCGEFVSLPLTKAGFVNGMRNIYVQQLRKGYDANFENKKEEATRRDAGLQALKVCIDSYGFVVDERISHAEAQKLYVKLSALHAIVEKREAELWRLAVEAIPLDPKADALSEVNPCRTAWFGDVRTDGNEAAKQHIDKFRRSVCAILSVPVPNEETP